MGVAPEPASGEPRVAGEQRQGRAGEKAVGTAPPPPLLETRVFTAVDLRLLLSM